MSAGIRPPSPTALATPTGAVTPTTRPPAGDPRFARRDALRRARQPLAAIAAIAVAALVMYLRPVSDLGFYYDDWRFLSVFTEAPTNAFGDLYARCTGVEDADRPGGCLYHSAVFALLGTEPARYHAMSIVFLVASTALIYALLRRCRLGHWPALLVCVLYVVYPGSDSTRLWATSVGAQYILAAYVAGVLLAIAGLRRRGRAGAFCHAASLALFVLMLFTYEVVVPLIAVAGAFYVLATSDRRAALRRGAVDLALAAGFAAYRLALAPIDEASGFVTQRTAGESLDHLVAVLRGAWTSWHTMFVPGDGVFVALVALVVVAAGAATDATVRRGVGRWLAIAAGAAAFAVLAVAPYAAAQDLYVPDTFSLFNRLNIAAAPAYCVLFVALCGAVWTALARWLRAPGATLAVGAAVVAVALSQARVERDSQDVWATSWIAQQAAIRGFERAAPRLPDRPVVMSFGHPIWERGFIPVFSSSWDMRGAIDIRTRVDPIQGMPFVDTATCGREATFVAGAPFAAYEGPAPLWFVNAASGDVRLITSRRRCEAAVAAWGRPPFWGASVTSPG